jgi:hypothetical protein
MREGGQIVIVVVRICAALHPFHPYNIVHTYRPPCSTTHPYTHSFTRTGPPVVLHIHIHIHLHIDAPLRYPRRARH